MLLTAVLVNSGITTNAAMINVDSESNVLQAKASDSVKTIAVEDGKSVDIRNTSTDTVTIETDLSSYYSRTVDIVFYNKEGIVTKYEHNFIGEIKLEAGEKARLTVSCGKAITLIENLADSEKISIENLQDDVKALFRLSIESGKNYKIKNNNNLSFDIQTNGSSYYGRNYDFVKYDSFSQISSFEYKSTDNSLSLGAGERVRITNENNNTIQFWFPQSLKSKFTVEEDKNAALLVTKLYYGKNYSIKNDNEANVSLNTDGSSYYNRKIDFVKYDALSNIKDFSSSYSTTSLDFAEGESYRITPGVNGITTWIPSDYKDKFIISETENKALEYYNVEAGKSVTITNNSDVKKDFATNLSSYNQIQIDYVLYDKDGKISEFDRDYSGRLSLDGRCKFDVTSSSETPFRFWIPSDYKDSIVLQTKAENAVTEYKLKPGKKMTIKNNGELVANIKASKNLNYSLNGDTDNSKTIRETNIKSKDVLNLENKTTESVSIYIPTSIMSNLTLGGDYSGVSVSGVKLVKNSDDILVGGTSYFGTYIAPVRATNKNVTWKSSDEKVATVDKDGKITGVSVGQATITAITEDGQKEASGIINVVEKLPTFFNVVYKDKDGNQIGETQVIKEGESAKEPEAPIIEGLEFVGWSTASDKITGDVTITPIYKDPNATEVEKYTVTFKVDGQVYGNVQTVNKGEAAVKPADPVKDGYTFVKWDKTFDNVTGNLEVSAVFEKKSDNPDVPEVEKYTVTFKVDGQVYGNVQTVNKGEAATKPADPVKDGYTFVKWDKTFDNVTGNLEVNAVFEKKSDNVQEAPTGDRNNLFNVISILTLAGATVIGLLKKKEQK